MMVRSRVPILAFAAAVVVLQHGVGAQNLTFSLFERYLEPLRVQAGIPGLSVAIVQDGQIVWERGLGQRDLEALHPALPDTPYPIADLTQTVTAALLLYCVDQGALRLEQPIGVSVPAVELPTTTLRQLVSHAAPGTVSGFKYDPGRYALLAHPIQTCTRQPFRKALALEVLDRLAMIDAVPGYDITTQAAEVLSLFDEATLERYTAVLQRMAALYKVDRRGRATRTGLPSVGVDGSNGLIASVRDLAKFDAALSVYLRPDTLAESWTNATINGAASPFGMGWFVQVYQGEKLVWHFGYTAEALSSLVLKVPGRRLTLILLANSDGLSAPFSLHEGDVTSSLFARTFLRLFIG